MHNTVKTVARLYLVAVVWLLAMLTTALASSALVNDALVSLGAGPVVSTASTMSMAVAVASTLAAVAWTRLRPAAHHHAVARSAQDEGGRLSSAPTR